MKTALPPPPAVVVPLRITIQTESGLLIEGGGNSGIVCTVNNGNGRMDLAQGHQVNPVAAFIVGACNSYAALQTALESSTDELSALHALLTGPEFAHVRGNLRSRIALNVAILNR